jgi:hypothetical protein
MARTIVKLVPISFETQAGASPVFAQERLFLDTSGFSESRLAQSGFLSFDGQFAERCDQSQKVGRTYSGSELSGRNRG